MQIENQKIEKIKKINPLNIFISLDTETYFEDDYKINSKNQKEMIKVLKFKLGWLIFNDVPKRIKKEIFLSSIDDFYNFLFEVDNKYNNKKIYVFAHNFSFDAQVLQLNKYLIKYFEIENVLLDKGIFYISAKLKNNTFIFVSSTNIFRMSLKYIGEQLNLYKMNINFNKDSDEYLKEYCLRDTQILNEILLIFRIFLLSHKFTFDITISKIGLKSFLSSFYRENVYKHNIQEVIEYEKSSYRGGRTEVFKKGKFNNLYYLDVNSLYPYVMKNKLPNKLLYYKYNPSKKEVLSLLAYDKLFIINCKIKTNYPIVGIKHDGKLIFPVGNFNATITSIELKEVLANGGDFSDIKFISVYSSENIFSKYIDYLFKLKDYYKKEKNKPFYLITKILMNSLYGKFGQINDIFKELNIIPDEKDFKFWQIYDVEKKEFIKFRQYGSKVFIKEGQEIAFYTFLPIPSFITAYARLHLWNLIKIAGLENVYYCDTDSLFVNKKGYKNLRKYLDDYELGKLKLEGIWKEVNIYTEKDYKGKLYTDGKIVEYEKLKGIKKNAKKLSDNEYLQEHFVSFKSNIKNYKKDGAIIEFRVKKLKRKITKRKEIDGNLHPFEIYD